MKTSCILKMAVALILCCSGPAMADNWKNESGQAGPPGGYRDGRDDRGQRPGGRRDDRSQHPGKRHDDRKRHGDRHAWKHHRDYHDHHGYRPVPGDRRPEYHHYEHRGRRYAYHGHWSSWQHWDAYARQHPYMARQGVYYRQDAHLMFRFCEPGTANCVFFSIGR